MALPERQRTVVLTPEPPEDAAPEARDPAATQVGDDPGATRVGDDPAATQVGDPGATVVGSASPETPADPSAGVEPAANQAGAASIGRFVLRRKLGAGGFAVVYQAYDPDLHRVVALKLMRVSKGSSTNAEVQRRRLVREAQAMARLNHPNVITVFEVGEHGDQVFVAMEYVQGGTLREWWRRQTRTRAEILNVFTQAARGLVAAHAAGLVHRDFKPENVLVGDDGRVRVLDLGLARLSDGPQRFAQPWSGEGAGAYVPDLSTHPLTDNDDDATMREAYASGIDPDLGRDPLATPLTRVGAVIGTPLYMAPEQHLAGTIDARTDQFAFCVALYEALYGQLPFEGKTYEELSARVIMGDLRDPPASDDVPPWLRKIVLRGLRTEPADRFSSMQELLDDIDAALAYEDARSGLARTEVEGARAAYLRGDRVEARAKLRGSLEIEDSTLGRALWWTLQRSPLAWRKQLGGEIQSVAVAASGRLVAAGSTDRCIYLVDTESLETKVLRGQAYWVSALHFGATGRYLAYADECGGAGLWDLEDRVPLRFAQGPAGSFAVVMDSEEEIVACAGYDGRIRLWERRTGAEIRTLVVGDQALLGLAFVRELSALATVDTTGSLSLWTLEGERLWALPAQAQALPRSFVAVHEARHWVAGPGPHGESAAVWDYGVSGAPRLVTTGHRHRGQVTSGAFLASRADRTDDAEAAPRVMLVTGSFDGVVAAWSPEDEATPTKLAQGRGQALALAVDPQDRIAAAIGGALELLRTDRGSEPEDVGHLGAVNGVAFDPSGTRLVSVGKDGTARVWDVATGDQTASFQVSTESLVSVAISPKGTEFAVGSFGPKVPIVSLSTGVESSTLCGHAGGVSDVCFGGEGRFLVTCSFDGTARWWDVASGQELDRYVAPGVVTALAFDSERNMVALGGGAPWVNLWSPGHPGHKPGPEGVEGGFVRGLAWLGEGRRLLWGDKDGWVHLWDREAAVRRSWQLASSRITRLHAASGAARVLAACADGIPRILHVETDEVEVFPEHGDHLEQAVFSPDESVVATACDDGTVRTFAAATRRPLWTRRAFLPDLGWVCSHVGWRALRELPGARPGPRMGARIEAGFGAVSLDAETCACGVGEGIEVWDLPTDTRLQALERPGVHECLVGDEVCAVRTTTGEVWLLGREAPRLLCSEALRVGVARRTVLVVRAEGLEAWSRSGRMRQRLAAPSGICAVGAVAQHVVVGFPDGGLERLPLTPSPLEVSPTFESTPSSPVERLCAGPLGTIVAGFRDGTIGMWSAADGRCLHRQKLHGAVTYLRYLPGAMFAMSELGQAVMLDLRALELDYPALRREVWAQVPVVWEGGRAVSREPPWRPG